MNRLSCVMMALALSGSVLAKEGANSVIQSRDPNALSPAVSLVLGGLKVTDKELELRYQVRNNSGQDIWVCNTNSIMDLVADNNGWVLRIPRRERRDISSDYFHAEYIRVHPGQGGISK